MGSTDTTDCDSELDGQIEEMAQAVDAVGDAEQRTVDALDDVRCGRPLPGPARSMNRPPVPRTSSNPLAFTCK